MAKIVFKELTSNQNVLFPVSLSEKIASNHPVRVVNSVVDALDISSLLRAYKGGGTSSYHPRMMLKVLLEKPRDFDPFGQTGFAHLWLQYN